MHGPSGGRLCVWPVVDEVSDGSLGLLFGQAVGQFVSIMVTHSCPIPLIDVPNALAPLFWNQRRKYDRRVVAAWKTKMKDAPARGGRPGRLLLSVATILTKRMAENDATGE